MWVTRRKRSKNFWNLQTMCSIFQLSRCRCIRSSSLQILQLMITWTHMFKESICRTSTMRQLGCVTKYFTKQRSVLFFYRTRRKQSIRTSTAPTQPPFGSKVALTPNSGARTSSTFSTSFTPATQWISFVVLTGASLPLLAIHMPTHLPSLTKSQLSLISHLSFLTRCITTLTVRKCRTKGSQTSQH